MNGLQRTRQFIGGEPVDRPPFHPIVMRWAARRAGVAYRDFCLDPEVKCKAMMQVADQFDADWVTTMSDPYCEAEAFGLEIEYPENDLPLDRGGHLPDAAAAARLQPYDPQQHRRCRLRVREIEIFRQHCGDRLLIVGWVEGPMAEYADLRGITEAALDLYDDPDAVGRAMDIITEAALAFISLQIKAGAHCIGIGDAFCSQIGPKLYRSFAFEREKRMVDHIHAKGALAKLHICGNTHDLIPDMLRTGADIIDIDHLVPSMAPFAAQLGPDQVFSGACDPVSVVERGTPDRVIAAVERHGRQAGGRCIVSAGCEITPGTPDSQMRALASAANLFPL